MINFDNSVHAETTGISVSVQMAELGIKGKIMVNFHSLFSDSSKQLMEH